MLGVKVLSAKQILKIFQLFGFEKVRQSGSHIVINRRTDLGNQTLVIPNHKELKKPTIRDIYNQASRYISSDDLFEHFFNK